MVRVWISCGGKATAKVGLVEEENELPFSTYWLLYLPRNRTGVLLTVLAPPETLWQHWACYLGVEYKGWENLLAKNSNEQGTPLVVQWLRIFIPMQGTQVQPLVGELRSHTPLGN